MTFLVNQSDSIIFTLIITRRCERLDCIETRAVLDSV